MMNADDYLAALHFELPTQRIAQRGAEPRDHSRLMAVAQGAQTAKQLQHQRFFQLPNLLRAGDLMVFNESRVIPARVMARKPQSQQERQQGKGGGKIEVMLLREEEHLLWSAYLKPARRAGPELWLGDQRAQVVGQLEDGARLLRFDSDIKPHLDKIGRLPLPPYIATNDEQEDYWQHRYQTVYAQESGSVAAPTAGLHFTPELLSQLDDMHIERCAITLHVGAGTFKPIAGPVSQHVMHSEQYYISPDVAEAVERARAEGRRIVAVGTTTLRALESAWDGQALQTGQAETRLFVTPQQQLRVADMLLTNFHLPDSTLLLLVAAFAGVPAIQLAYQEALALDYRFYSLGDAMLLHRVSEQ